MSTPSQPWRHHPLLAEMLAYWRSKCAGAYLPRRADIDPLEIDRRLLPHTLLTERVVENGRRRYRFRLAGTAMIEAAGLELTGLYVDTLNPNRRYAAYIEGLYDRVAETRRPVYSESAALAARSRSTRLTRRLTCPLASDGTTVDMFLSAQVFEEHGVTGIPSLTFADEFEPGPTIVVPPED